MCDTHIRGTNPRSRLDVFPSTLQLKLAEVIHLARVHGVAAILHGGDLFDRPDVAPVVARDFLKILMQAPCPIYGIAGNHCIYSYNPGTIPRTMSGLYDEFGVVRLIRPGENIVLEQDGVKTQVTGQEFHAEMDRREPSLDYCVGGWDSPHPHRRQPGMNFAIHLTHGMLLDQPMMEGVAQTLLSQVDGCTMADVTFGAHFHPGWRAKWDKQGSLWLNPGSLVRLGNQRSDYERMPQVCLLELERGKLPQYQMIRLQCARPGEEILDRSRPIAELAREQALQEFVEGVGDVATVQGDSVQGIMERIAAHKGMSAPVQVESLRRLGIAQEALGRGEVE